MNVTNVNVNLGFFAGLTKSVAMDVAIIAKSAGVVSREAAGVSVIAAAAGSCIAADYIAAKANQAAGAMNTKTSEMATMILARQQARLNAMKAAK